MLPTTKKIHTTIPSIMSKTNIVGILIKEILKPYSRLKVEAISSSLKTCTSGFLFWKSKRTNRYILHIAYKHIIKKSIR